MNPTARPQPPARRWSRSLLWVAFAVVLTLRWLFPPEPREAGGQGMGGFDDRPWRRRAPARVHPPQASVPPDLWRIQIELAPDAVEQLRSYQWQGRWGPRPRVVATERPDVIGTVREGSNVFPNVAIHLKGAAGSFRPLDDKPSLTLNFTKHNKNAALFHGYSKISLNNSVQDPSFLCEAIARELFLDAGVPAPRADHATVLINGRDLGLYVLTEGWGKTFLRRHFTNVKGNLYDGGFIQDVHPGLEVVSGDAKSDHTALERLLDAAQESNPARRWQRLRQVLDADRFATFLALEIMTAHWDGYAMNLNNYRLFHDQATDRVIFMPHGMDQMFGVFRSSPSSSIQPSMQGMVAHAMLTSSEGRALYFERIARLRERVFVPEKLTNRVHQLARRIRPTLAAYAPDAAEEHDAAVAYLCQRIIERAQSISEQLAAPQTPVEFGADGQARLDVWTPQVTSRRRGAVEFDRFDNDGTPVLRVTAGRGGGAGAWRARALLEPGRYRFEARVQTRGVGGDGGVALRLAGTRDVWGQASDNEWTDLSYRFGVHGALTEVELFCELRSRAGEAWFDQKSLRLVRE